MPQLQMMLLVAVSLSVLPMLGVAGCGTSGGSDTEKVEATVLGYLADLGEGDGAGACSRLSSGEATRIFEEAVTGLPELKATSCATALTSLSESMGGEAERLEHAEIDSVKVDGDSATATLVGGTATAELAETEGGWLIVGGLSLGQ